MRALFTIEFPQCLFFHQRKIECQGELHANYQELCHTDMETKQECFFLGRKKMSHESNIKTKFLVAQKRQRVGLCFRTEIV
jgi:hypothetical protein